MVYSYVGVQGSPFALHTRMPPVYNPSAQTCLKYRAKGTEHAKNHGLLHQTHVSSFLSRHFLTSAIRMQANLLT